MSDSIAITSGKGGVGKTTVSVNLSIAFQKLQSKVLLLDTDLGMANSHVLLGVNPTNNLSSVINGNKKISEVVVKTDYGIELVSGGSATSDLLNLENKKRFRVLNEIDDYLKNYEKVKNWYAVIKSRPTFRCILEESIYNISPSSHYKDLDF